MTLKESLELIKQQASIIEELREENALLRAEINVLKDKLNINSKNTSLPPSRDLYKIKNATRKKSLKRPGGQPGHDAHHRKLEIADKEIECPLPKKCNCGGKIEFSNEHTVVQKAELPKIKPFYTNYNLHKGICLNCKKKKTAALPSGVSPKLLEPRAEATVAALSGIYGQSKREVQDILKNIFNFKISTGLVSKTEKRVSKKLLPQFKEYEKQLASSSYLHIDETGFKNKGNRFWCWVLANHQTAAYYLDPSRGKKVLLKKLPNYTGTVISDRYSAYNVFESKNRQICLAHLLRNFERFANSSYKEVAVIGNKLVETLRSVFREIKNREEEDVGEYNFKIAIQKIKSRVHSLLEDCLEITEAKHAIRVAKRIISAQEMMWKFVDNSSIDATNNHAERLLRRIVLYRKKCLFVWSDTGARFLERVLSIAQTSRLNRENPYAKILSLVSEV